MSGQNLKPNDPIQTTQRVSHLLNILGQNPQGISTRDLSVSGSSAVGKVLLAALGLMVDLLAPCLEGTLASPLWYFS